MTDIQNEEESVGSSGTVRRQGSGIGIAILVGYLVLLGIGVIAQVFNIQYVLDWWVFRAPGS